MATTDATLYDVKNGAAWITLNRPENRNALSSVLVLELYEHLLVANDDPNVRCIVITGTDPAFCAGAASVFSFAFTFLLQSRFSLRGARFSFVSLPLR